jgi:glutathione synthase/RimK-type ligase-like ATP-grasp enzyme
MSYHHSAAVASHDRRDPSGGPMIAVIAEQRHAGDAAIQGTMEALRLAGAAVQLVAPDPEDLFDIPAEAPSWDAAVSRGRSPAVLSLLAGAASLGVFAVNPPRAIDLVRNKVAMQSVLVRHGIPVPRAWFAATPSAFARVPIEHYPLVIKPFDGDSSAGLWFAPRPTDLPTDGGAIGRLYVAQEYLDAQAHDLKLYGVGSKVWAVRKAAPVVFDGPGPARPQSPAEAQVSDLDARLQDIALTCGRACGLEIWGVDVAMTADGPYVIEVNDFPTYSAVPEAGDEIARHILTLTQIDVLRRASGQERMRSLVWTTT